VRTPTSRGRPSIKAPPPELLSYAELGLVPPNEYDYSKHPGNWCRYCGARNTSAWNRGPWGKNTLCIPHYVSWWQKKTLSLSGYHEIPTRPIAPENNSELRYLTWRKSKEREEKEEVSREKEDPRDAQDEDFRAAVPAELLAEAGYRTLRVRTASQKAKLSESKGSGSSSSDGSSSGSDGSDSDGSDSDDDDDDDDDDSVDSQGRKRKRKSKKDKKKKKNKGKKGKSEKAKKARR
jgi:hypothetical protein